MALCKALNLFADIPGNFWLQRRMCRQSMCIHSTLVYVFNKYNKHPSVECIQCVTAGTIMLYSRIQCDWTLLCWLPIQNACDNGSWVKLQMNSSHFYYVLNRKLGPVIYWKCRLALCLCSLVDKQLQLKKGPEGKYSHCVHISCDIC